LRQADCQALPGTQYELFADDRTAHGDAPPAQIDREFLAHGIPLDGEVSAANGDLEGAGLDRPMPIAALDDPKRRLPMLERQARAFGSHTAKSTSSTRCQLEPAALVEQELDAHLPDLRQVTTVEQFAAFDLVERHGVLGRMRVARK